LKKRLDNFEKILGSDQSGLLSLILLDKKKVIEGESDRDDRGTDSKGKKHEDQKD
jgi:hypothetical protein